MGEAPQVPAETPVNPVAPDVPQPIEYPKLLIGEGREEFFFFRALLRRLHLVDVKVEQYGGKNNLSNYLEALIVRPGYLAVSSLAITRDADGYADRAFQSVCGALKNNSLPVPAAPGDIAPGPPLVRVLILPGGGRPGMLEDLCMDAAASQPVIRCVDEFIDCLHALGHDPQPLAKARTRAWLASLETPDLELGEAAAKGLIDFGHSAFAELRSFLQSL